jgi:archaellum component FlaC
MEELYRKYGELMVTQEILQNQINQVKQAISQELNKQKDEVKENVPK